jgi:hypothetical protein
LPNKEPDWQTIVAWSNGMSRTVLIAGVCLGMVVLLGMLGLSERSSLAPEQQARETQVIAARYPLRSRTNNFYSRATPGGNPSNNARR